MLERKIPNIIKASVITNEKCLLKISWLSCPEKIIRNVRHASNSVT